MAESAAATSAAQVKAENADRQLTPGAGPDAARLLVGLALMLTALAYANTLRFQFVYDDLPQIINNPRVHSLAHVPRLFVEHVWSQFAGRPGTFYRPLFEVWLTINYSLFGLNPAWWHLTTVLAHLGVVAMVYVLARRIMRDRLAAAIATVIFALHPTHIETVAWVSGVPDALLAVFAIGSVLSYARSREDVERAALWRAVSVATYGLGMLCKETGVMLPAVFFAYDRLLFAPRTGKQDGWLELLRRYAPYAVVALGYLAVRQHVLHGFGPTEPKPWRDVALSLPSFLWFYVRELVWPVGLSVFRDTPLVHTPGLTNFALPLAGLALAVGALVYVGRRAGEVAFGAWWLLVFMIPPIVGIYTFVPEDLVHDRYLYLPSVGFAIVIGWAVRRLRSGERVLFGAPSVPMTVTLGLAALLAAGTAAQNVTWQNDLVLYANAVKTAPRNVLAIDHLANELYKRRRPEEALALYRQAVQINPRHWTTRFALGVTLYDLKNYPEAQEQLSAAIPLLPANADQFYYLGMAQMQQGHYAEAEANFRQAIRIFGGNPLWRHALAISLERQGKLMAARDELRMAWEMTRSPEVKRELDRVEQAIGR